MPEVIGQDESVTKITTCKNCGARLKYYPREVQEDYSTDYIGDKDYYNYIVCPKCGERVKVKRY